MKKLIIFGLAIFPLLVNGQSVRWSGSIVVDNMVSQDTSVQASYSVSDINGSDWSVTISSDTSAVLDTSVTVTFGGSNNRISESSRFAFEGINNENLPYRFYIEDHVVITNEDTTYQQSFVGTNYPFARPQLWLDKDSASTGTFKYDFLFTKP